MDHRDVLRRYTLFIGPVALAAAMGSSAADPSSCKLVRLAEFPLRPSQSQLVTEGVINGRKLGILIDTGAERSVLMLSAARWLRLDLEPATGHFLYGLGGESRAMIARINEIRLGGAVRKNWRVLAVGEQDPGQDISFILGYDFLRQTDVEFDLANNAVRLYQSKDCKGSSLAYWAPAGASEVNVESDSDHPGILFSVHINGKPIQAELDSGASRSVISKRQAGKLGVTPETPGVFAGPAFLGVGRSRVESWIGSFESFALGDEIVRNPKIKFLDLSRTRMSSVGPVSMASDIRPMLLGVDFLRSHRVLVAHSQGKMYFSYVGGPVFDVPDSPRRPAAARQADTAPAGEGVAASDTSGGAIAPAWQEQLSSLDPSSQHAVDSRSGGLQILKSVSKDSAGRIRYDYRARNTTSTPVYLRIFLTSCVNCSDGLFTGDAKVNPGATIELGSVEQTDVSKPWKVTYRWGFRRADEQ